MLGKLISALRSYLRPKEEKLDGVIQNFLDNGYEAGWDDIAYSQCLAERRRCGRRYMKSLDQLTKDDVIYYANKILVDAIEQVPAHSLHDYTFADVLYEATKIAKSAKNK